MKVGDILISLSDENYVTLCVLIDNGKTESKVVREIGTIYTAPNRFLHSIDSVFLVRERITNDINSQINDLKLKLKSVKRSDYEFELRDKYLLLKTEILNTMKNTLLIDEIDDNEFENKLKSICDKKRQLFELDSDEIYLARKYNGEIKHEIKKLEKLRDSELNKLSEENLNNTIKKFRL